MDRYLYHFFQVYDSYPPLLAKKVIKSRPIPRKSRAYQERWPALKSYVADLFLSGVAGYSRFHMRLLSSLSD